MEYKKQKEAEEREKIIEEERKLEKRIQEQQVHNVLYQIA